MENTYFYVFPNLKIRIFKFSGYSRVMHMEPYPPKSCFSLRNGVGGGGILALIVFSAVHALNTLISLFYSFYVNNVTINDSSRSSSKR